MDYKIKFEYKGIGKQAANIRSKVLQAQKSMKKPEIPSVGGKELISLGTHLKKLDSSISKLTASNKSLSKKTSSKSLSPVELLSKKDDKITKTKDKKGSIPLNEPLKTLNSSILKLISSNKDLSKNISGKGPSRPSSLPGGMPSSGGGRMPGSGAIKSGGIAAIGIAGFAIQKINQVGNAYIEKTAQQAGSVGIGGFRRGQGMYQAAEIGGGMKAYGMATGKFVKGKKEPDKTALDVGAIYGLSADETLRTAGQFKRAGASYKEAAQTGAGMGIESELPMLLTGMANILTDAVREGVNTSDMSKDMAKEISSLTMVTPGKSVDAALNIIKSFSGVKQQVAGGKIGGTEGLFATIASQQLLMKKLTGKGKEKFIKRLQEDEFFEEKHVEIAKGLDKDSTFSDLQKAMPKMSWALLKKSAAEAQPGQIQSETHKISSKLFDANTAEGRAQYYDFKAQQGHTGDISKWEALGRKERKNKQEKEIFEGLGYTDEQKKGYKKIQKGLYGDVKKEGAKKISDKAKAVEESAAGQSIKRIQARTDLLLDYGASFADASLKMEKSMMNIARDAAPAAIGAINLLATATTGASNVINKASSDISKVWSALKKGDFKGARKVYVDANK